MIELHCHTTVSDGTLTPGELVELAASLGITHLAITDHDSTGGVKEAARACGSRDIVLIPGVEMSAKFRGGPWTSWGTASTLTTRRCRPPWPTWCAAGPIGWARCCEGSALPASSWRRTK